MMGYEGNCQVLPVPVVGPPRGSSLCMQAVGGGLSGLAALISDESVLEVCIHDDALYKSTFFTFTFTFTVK